MPRSGKSALPLKPIVWIVAVAVLAGGLYATRSTWLPKAKQFIDVVQNKKETTAEDDHDHDHADAPTESPDTLKLSESAWKNLGLRTGVVVASDFTQEISHPAVVVDRPGQSRVQITAPLTGIVTRVYPLEREIVEPGAPLFQMRLTHEDVVKAQSEFLKSLQELDIVEQELDRLNRIGGNVIPGKRIVAQKYLRDTAEASLSAMRQSLLLHDLSQQQIDDIERTRNVLQEFTVEVPQFSQHAEGAQVQHLFHVQSLNVSRGQSVQHGESLGTLADHSLLYVEGQAFEDDANRLIEAARDGGTVKVVPVSSSANSADVLHLEVQSVAAEVDPQTRALKFYLLLPNELLNPEAISSTPSSSSQQKRFVSWKYRPGYRMECRVPLERTMENKIVLPIDAVAIDGPNAFVFEQNGDNFDRIDVQVLHRDSDTIVIENDGQLIGSSIAMKGAYQMQVALKNSAGGAIDPHAGHTH